MPCRKHVESGCRLERGRALLKRPFLPHLHRLLLTFNIHPLITRDLCAGLSERDLGARGNSRMRSRRKMMKETMRRAGGLSRSA